MATLTAPAASANRAGSPAFTRFAWGVLGWNLLVVLWGAYVRASGSGAGCGSHWPLCNGEVLPRAPKLETIIEFAHRVTSGATVIPVVGLAVWSFFRFPRPHRVQKAALYSVVFLLIEAALGAGLVLFKYVASNASPGHAFYLCLHLVNTQLLLAALALTAWFSRDDAAPPGPRSPLLKGTLVAALLVSATGVIAALGDTLFPAASLAAGFKQDLDAASSLLPRLRIAHPILAVASGIYFIVAAITVLRSKPLPVSMKIAMSVLLLSLTQLCAGVINLALLAPIWMQIVHLFLANLVWISLVLLTAESAKTLSGSAARS